MFLCPLLLQHVLLSFAVFDTAAAGLDGEANSPVVNAVIESWTRRQSIVRSFDFTWSGRKVERPEFRVSPRLFNMAKKMPDLSYQSKARLALDPQGRAHVHFHTLVYSEERGEFEPSTTTHAGNSKWGKTLFHPTHRHSNLFVQYPGKVAGTLKVCDLTPIAIIYRPFDAALGRFRADLLRATELSGMHEKYRYFAVKHLDDLIWVDPDRDFVPIRYYETRNGKPVRTMDIQYQVDEKMGWVPSSFRDVNEDFKYSTTQKVLSFDINTELPEELFDIVAPVGTMVTNYLTKEVYIQLDKGKRPIRHGEYDGTNYEQLLKATPSETESPTARPANQSWRMVLAVAAPACLLLILAIVYYRRKSAG